MNSKRMIAIFLCILVLGAAVIPVGRASAQQVAWVYADAIPAQESAGAPEPGWQKYFDVTYGLHIWYPAAWRYQLTADNPGVADGMLRQITFLGPDRARVVVSIWPKLEQTELKDWVQEHSGVAYPAEIDWGASPNAWIAGVPAFFAAWSQTRQAPAVLQTVFAKHDRVFVLSYVAVDAGAAETTYNKILRHMYLDRPANAGARLPEMAAKPWSDAVLCADDSCCGYSSPGNPYSCFGNGNCVWWAWYKRPDLPWFWGNAKDWATQAKGNPALAPHTGTTPQVGAIAVFEEMTEYGHVAYVEEVSGSRFRVSEMWYGNGCDGLPCHVCTDHWYDSASLFIYQNQQATHLECIDNNCTRVPGSGTDMCSAENSDCAPLTHLTCVDGRCTRVNGAGSNNCATEGSTSECPVPSQTWSAEYFVDRSCSDWRCNTGIRCTETIQGELNKTWGNAPCSGMSREDWGARFTTTADFAAGDYVFHARHDDGVKIWLDDSLVLDKWSSCGTDSSCPKVRISAGRHTVRVVYRQDAGEAYLRVWWDGDDQQCNEICTIGAEQVVLHTAPNYLGLCVTLGIGEYPLSSLGHIGNDNLRSVEVGSNVQLVLYENDGFNGLQEAFTAGDRDLTDNRIGYNTSSVKVLRQSCPVPLGTAPLHEARLVQTSPVVMAWNNTCAQSWLEYWSDADPQHRGPDTWLTEAIWSVNLGCGRYEWRIRGKNGSGVETDWSPSYAFSVVPATPSGLYARALSQTEVRLTWNDPGGEKTGYVIYRDDNTRIDTSSETSATIRDLQANTAYRFRVTAVAGDLESDKSDAAEVTTPAACTVALSHEAEAGEMDFPMQVFNDPTAQGGQYVSSPVGNDGGVSYTFVVTEEADYEIWGRVAAENVGSNSFRVRLDDWPGVTWELHVGAWSWLRVSDRTAQSDDLFYHLEACSQHTLLVTTLEANAKLDTIELRRHQPDSDPTPTPIVAVVPSPVYASVNAPVTVSVVVSDVVNLGAFEFSLGFDSHLVTVQRMSLGEFPGSSGRNFSVLGPDVDNRAGNATFRAYSTGTTPVGPTGSGVLVWVVLQPQAVGDATLRLLATQVTDVQGIPIPTQIVDGVIRITHCPEDLNGDGQVSISDVQAVAYRVGTQVGDDLYAPRYDVDSDGNIDISDVQRVAYRLGTVCGMQRSAQSSTLPSALVSVLPQASSVQVGDTFQISVVISDVVDMGAFDLILGYDPALVEVTAAQLGALPSSTGRTVVAIGPTVDRSAGTVQVGYYSLGSVPEGPTGNGTLATLTLRALRPGQSQLTVQNILVTDRSGAAQPVSRRHGELDVVPTLMNRLYLPVVIQ